MNENIKKTIAREGLILIGTFLSVLILFSLDNNGFDFDYLFEAVPIPFLILYGSYVVVRFIIWSFIILKLKESKIFKNIIYAICILLLIFVLGFSSMYIIVYKNQKLNNRMAEMANWVTIKEVAEISRKKYPDDKYYQEVYKRLDILNDEFEKEYGLKPYDLIPLNNSADKLGTEEFKYRKRTSY